MLYPRNPEICPRPKHVISATSFRCLPKQVLDTCLFSSCHLCDTGHGWVKARKGLYHDAVHVKRSATELVLHKLRAQPRPMFLHKLRVSLCKTREKSRSASNAPRRKILRPTGHFCHSQRSPRRSQSGRGLPAPCTALASTPPCQASAMISQLTHC